MLAGSRRLKGERAKVEVDHRPVIKKQQQHNSIHTDPSCHSIVVQNDRAPRDIQIDRGKESLGFSPGFGLGLSEGGD